MGLQPRLCSIVVGIWAIASSTAVTAADHSPFRRLQKTAVECTAPFAPISATAWVEAINPGWNLGNTLDAVPTEGSWNNPPVVAATFQDIKAAGFKSVRIPVTYTNHFTSGAPDYTVDATWLKRVSDVVDMATTAGLYVLTNVHHDASDWLDITQSSANLTAIEAKFYRLWYQIGESLKCKASTVALEPVNEPPSNTAADAAEINHLNSIFLKALTDSGGYNPQRVVTLVGPSMDAAKTSQYFVAPKNITNPWALQFHYYSPYDFIFGAWGKTIWGSDADKAALASDFGIVRGNFTDVPLVIGEFGTGPASAESASRWKYTDYIIRAANDVKAATMLWDNGLDFFDRAAHAWRDPITVDLIMETVAGTSNSLPDSTTDANALTQSSSAYIWQKVGSQVVDQTLPWLFNGNTLTSIKTSDGVALKSDDYAVGASAITFHAAFLSRYVSSTAEPGIKANLSLAFSAGAPSMIQIVQWDQPVITSTSSRASASSDLYIPITYKGLSHPAAVKMSENGTYLFDTWTQWLPTLQQGRATYSGQWNWDTSHLIIPQSTVQAVVSAGVPTTFVWEFYPRVPGNNVTYILNP